MSKKYYIALDDYERGTIINCLNEKRNKLIADVKYTDAVDEVLFKIINAKQKKFVMQHSNYETTPATTVMNSTNIALYTIKYRHIYLVGIPRKTQELQNRLT